eukprot:733588-Pyramimonas_sp.AAC.2
MARVAPHLAVAGDCEPRALNETEREAFIPQSRTAPCCWCGWVPSPVYSHNGPIGCRKSGYIPITDQSDTTDGILRELCAPQ